MTASRSTKLDYSAFSGNKKPAIKRVFYCVKNGDDLHHAIHTAHSSHAAHTTGTASRRIFLH